MAKLNDLNDPVEALKKLGGGFWTHPFEKYYTISQNGNHHETPSK